MLNTTIEVTTSTAIVDTTFVAKSDETKPSSEPVTEIKKNKETKKENGTAVKNIESEPDVKIEKKVPDAVEIKLAAKLEAIIIGNESCASENFVGIEDLPSPSKKGELLNLDDSETF